MNKITNNLLKNLKVAHTEADVAAAWRGAFTEKNSGSITCLDRSDGILKTPTFNALLEFKYRCNLENPRERSNVIVQDLKYLKEAADRGESLGVLSIEDKEKLCLISTKDLEKYLSFPGVDWNTAATALAEKYPELVDAISNDKNIQPSIRYVNDKDFDVLYVLKEMESISHNKLYITPITAKNFRQIYERFDKAVIAKPFEKGSVWMEDGATTAYKPDLFMVLLTSPGDCSIHPNNENIAVIGSKELRINPTLFKEVEESIKNIRPSELDKIVANKDRLLEELYRRYTGAFFTPPLFVDEAHKIIASQLGPDWKDEYVVWDCAAGTANLTRDYKFKELYISTLEQGDVDTIKACGYNPEATIFQYDFLSEIFVKGSVTNPTGIDSIKIPSSLRKALEEGRDILILINPPYGAVGFGEKAKPGIAKNAVNDEMKKGKMRTGSSELSSQFLYKILSLKSVYPQARISVALFAGSTFMTLPSYKKFSDLWKSKFTFLGGMLFSAKHFSDISSDWGVSFTIWGDREVFPEQPSKIVLTLKDVNPETQEIEDVGTKEIYAPNGNNCSKWVKEGTKGLATVIVPTLINAVKTSAVKEKQRGKLVSGALGYFAFGYNNVSDNDRYAYLLSSVSSQGQGLSITSGNFREAMALFTARATIKSTWKIYQDEYLVPDTHHPDYEQWNNDAIPFSLFNGSSQQSSLRGIPFKGGYVDIKNEFFFMSQQEMVQLADDNSFNEMYQDAKAGEDRYVYKLLQTTQLSEDAQKVLQMAQELVRKSIGARKEYHKKYPERHLQAWDAGWAQLRPMLKEHFRIEYKEFVKAYKAFEDRMREGVYKFGFLKT